MTDYKIIDNGFWFPQTESWIVDSFNLKAEQAVLYCMIMNKGYVTWTLPWMAYVFRCSEDKLTAMLDILIKKEVIAKKVVCVQDGGLRKRNVYVALYTKKGKRSEQEVENLFERGCHKLSIEYGEKRYYKKKKK